MSLLNVKLKFHYYLHHQNALTFLWNYSFTSVLVIEVVTVHYTLQNASENSAHIGFHLMTSVVSAQFKSDKEC